MKLWLEKNDIEMYSMHTEGKILQYQKMTLTSISKNEYTDKLDDIVNKCNNTYHKTIKRKPAGIKQSTYIDSSKEINDK